MKAISMKNMLFYMPMKVPIQDDIISTGSYIANSTSQPFSSSFLNAIASGVSPKMSPKTTLKSSNKKLVY